MSTNTKVTIEKTTVPSSDTAVVSTHHSMTHSSIRSSNFFFGGGGSWVFCIREKFNLGEGMGILCELRSEVSKCTKIISNGGEIFWTQVSKSSLRSWVGGGILVQNILFCVILTFSSHWAKLSITDSLSHTMCVEINNGYCSSLGSHLLFIEICFVAKII